MSANRPANDGEQPKQTAGRAAIRAAESEKNLKGAKSGIAKKN